MSTQIKCKVSCSCVHIINELFDLSLKLIPIGSTVKTVS